MGRLTLTQLWRLAVTYAPRAAARADFLTPKNGYSWTPAHELAHAVLSTKDQRGLPNYGMCEIESCRCPRESCHLVEGAVMRLSFA